MATKKKIEVYENVDREVESLVLRKKINKCFWSDGELIGFELADHTIVKFKDGKVEK